MYFKCASFIINVSLTVGAALNCQVSFAYETDANGNYVVTYADSVTNTLQAYVFIPSTKVVPTVVTVMQPSGSDTAFSYTIANGTGASQGIISFGFTSPTPWTALNVAAEQQKIGDARFDPALYGQAIRDFSKLQQDTAALYGSAPAGFSVDAIFSSLAFGFSWGPLMTTPIASWATIAPGQQLDGFYIHAPYLPGIAQAGIRGLVPDGGDPPTPADADAEIEQTDLDEQLIAIMNVDFVGVLVPAPVVAIPFPFDGAMLTVNVKNELARWPSLGQASPFFVTQLSVKLDGLANSIRTQNVQGATDLSADIQATINAAAVADLSPFGATLLKFDVQEILRRWNETRGNSSPAPDPGPGPGLPETS